MWFVASLRTHLHFSSRVDSCIVPVCELSLTVRTEKAKNTCLWCPHVVKTTGWSATRRWLSAGTRPRPRYASVWQRPRQGTASTTQERVGTSRRARCASCAWGESVLRATLL
jgi:hypothetical protein